MILNPSGDGFCLGLVALHLTDANTVIGVFWLSTPTTQKPNSN
jgi:hypothetical protein